MASLAARSSLRNDGMMVLKLAMPITISIHGMYTCERQIQVKGLKV
jgi:hypothetical protein